MNEALTGKWAKTRGLSVASVALGSVTLPEADQQMIQQLQRSAVLRNPTMAGATLVNAQAQAMQDAAKNPNGAMTGFMGMGMAGQAGGMNAGSLFAMGQNEPAAPAPAGGAAGENTWKCSCGATATGNFCPQCGAKKPEAKADGEWVCPKCGAKNSGKFCAQCGEKKPADADGWTCACGAVNKGKFCTQCGKPKPAGAKLYRCSKCGWEPADPEHPPKFCPQCGDPFDDGDVK